MARLLPVQRKARQKAAAQNGGIRIRKNNVALVFCTVVLVSSSFFSFEEISRRLQDVWVDLGLGQRTPNTTTISLSHIPPEQQWTSLDFNYSTTNQGEFKNGKWRSTRNLSEVPPLFMDRLNHFLPECPKLLDGVIPENYTPCDNETRLFPEDVEKIEKEVLKFDIPHKIVIALQGGYISPQHWRWNQIIDSINHTLGTRKMCPNCHIRFHKDHFLPPNLTLEPAHVRIYGGCNSHKHERMVNGTERDYPDQVLIGDCGESQFGTGRQFWSRGFKRVDYSMNFVDKGSPFVRTYAHLHLSPDKVYGNEGMKALHNVTDFVSQLLTTPVLPFPRHVNNTEIRQRILNASLTTETLETASLQYDAAFIHSNCGTSRGRFLRAMLDEGMEATIARYGKCFHNVDPPQVMGWGWDKDQDRFHNHGEGHRDAAKTALVSHHKFAFALENTLSPYYFTEKRWQVLLAASVPIVWDNHNSIQYLPDPDAAIRIPAPEGSNDLKTSAKEASKTIHYYAQPENEQEYMDKYFAWKKRGLRPDFVRKLFMSSDFVLCRICEYMAHHHFYEDQQEDKA